jgi:hypothetical protein
MKDIGGLFFYYRFDFCGTQIIIDLTNNQSAL